MTVAYIVLTAIAAPILFVLLFDRLAPATAARLGMALDRWRSGLRLKQVRVGGTAMPYLEGGHGDPLVLIHGFGGDKDNFARIARFLTPHYRVIIPDLPGFGDAGRDPSASHTMTEQAARLRAFLARLGLASAHMGGNSMGGFIAVQYAATYPQRTASLWLLDAAGTAAAQDSRITRHYEQTGEMPLLLRKEEDVAELIRATMHRPPFFPYSVRRTLGRRAVADYDLHASIMRQLHASPLLEDQFQNLTTPTLIVWGKEDKILNPAGAETLRTLLPNSQVNLMERVGHLPMLEEPRRTARDYLDFRRTQGI